MALWFPKHLSLTMRQQPDIFHPDHRNVEIFAGAFMTNVGFHHGCVAAEALFLDLSERRTSFHQINRFNARRKRPEVPQCLFIQS